MHTSEIERSMVTVPAFADVVPVEAKLRELGVYALKGRFGKRNPNPFANYFGEFELLGHPTFQFFEDLLDGEFPVEIAFRKIHIGFYGCVLGHGLGFPGAISDVFADAGSISDNCSVQFRSSELFLLFVLFCLLVFMVLFFDLCCSVSDSSPSPPKALVSWRRVGGVLGGHHALAP